ncbi:MAG: NADPH:quinone reductase [Burkholderiales bacterium]
MKAAWYETQGTPKEAFKVGEMPDPTPGPGEVRVRMRASGANPSDTYTRSGLRRRGLPYPRIIPHQDGAGVIDAVGVGVAASRVGERVWIYMAQAQRAFGTCAEYCALPSERAPKMPDNCSFNEGASLGIPWLTAHYAVDVEGDVKGQTVLVGGGTGAVGYYCIQIAKARGARVIASVGSAEKGAIARAAGADEVVDFRSEDVGERIGGLTGGRGADRILEPFFAKNAALYPKMLAKNGSVIVYGAGGAEGTISAGWGIQMHPTIRFIYMYELPADAYVKAVNDFTAMQSGGELKHLPVREFSLDQIAAVHEAVEAGNSGTRMIVKFQ